MSRLVLLTSLVLDEQPQVLNVFAVQAAIVYENEVGGHVRHVLMDIGRAVAGTFCGWARNLPKHESCGEQERNEE
jgi:hypothetical protein